MSSIPKHLVYKMWASDGTYLGVLQNVTSEFVLSQDINTIGPNIIQITVGQSADTAYKPVRAILSEDNRWITTEDGRGLTTEGEAPNYAVSHSKIRNGNKLKIIEYSDYHPNGLVIFQGIVRKWNVNFGTNDDSTLYVSPSSVDMNGHIVKSSEQIIFSQTVSSGSFAVFGGTSGQRMNYFFDYNGAGISNVSSIALMVAAQSTAVSVTVSLVLAGNSAQSSDYNTLLNNVDNPNNIIQQSTVSVSSTSAAEVKFTFPATAVLNSANIYGILITSNGSSGTGATIAYTDTDVVSGTEWANTNDGTGWQIGVPPNHAYNGDIYFRLYYIPPYTKAKITNFEPSSLVSSFMGNYNGEGGGITAPSANIQTTGLTIPSYTFQLNIIPEGLDAMLSLAPKDFYYTVDVGSKQLTFKQSNTTTPDYKLIFRRHIQSLDLSATIENLENDVFVTGGKSGSTNIFAEQKNSTSSAQFGTYIGRPTDQHITDTPTAQGAASTYLDKHDDEQYETTVVIPDTLMDITQFKLGQTVSFRGFSTFVDTLVLPIVRFERSFTEIKLSLGVIPTRESSNLVTVQDQVQSLSTIDNPTTPS